MAYDGSPGDWSASTHGSGNGTVPTQPGPGTAWNTSTGYGNDIGSDVSRSVGPPYPAPAYETQTQYTPPQYDQTRYDQPRYDQPRYDEPRYDQPRYDQQRYDEPRYDQTRYDQTRYDQTRYDQTRYDQTRYDQTRYDQPQYVPAPPYEEPPHVQYRSPSGEPMDGTDPVVDITPTGQWSAPGAESAVVYPMRNGAGTAALVLGCLALAFTGVLFVLFPVGIVLALFAVVLGRRGRRRARYGFASNGASASAGLGLGTASLLLGALLTAGTVWFAMSYSVADIKDCIADNSTAPAAAHCAVDVLDRG